VQPNVWGGYHHDPRFSQEHDMQIIPHSDPVPHIPMPGEVPNPAGDPVPDQPSDPIPNVPRDPEPDRPIDPSAQRPGVPVELPGGNDQPGWRNPD